ncbi:thymidylate synthase [Methylorubrum rhodesianum]|uniref:thymidylate synthase n=1 Tax=Methylorubrum rhodesianum TaxID=29427 RepID=UPI003D01230D
MFIEGETIDDLLRKSIEALQAEGRHIEPSKGDALEAIGATLRLANPLARFSRTEGRGVISSAIGETLWYLSGSDDFDAIEYYIPRYRGFCETPADVSKSEAAYGPRLKRQLNLIIEKIKKNNTRKAVLSIYREEDHYNRYDVPCTCTIQFLPRSGFLHAVAQMRSNDVYKGMPHDIFAFTFLQEFLARSAGLQLGHYIHQVGSFHLYYDDLGKAERYLKVGVADVVPMDAMPDGDPQPGLQWLLDMEKALREKNAPPSADGIQNYWLDLANLLRVRPLRDAGDKDSLMEIQRSMQSAAFKTFIQDEIYKA